MADNVVGEINTSAYTLQYKWVINYDCLSGKNMGDVLKSPVFTTTADIGNSCHQWQIELYPNGLSEDCKNFISIYLCLLSGGQSTVKVSFEIVNNNSELVVRNSANEHVFNAGRDWGFSKFVKRDVIEKNNMEGGGKLTIVCEMIVGENKKQKNYSKLRQLAADFEQLIDDKEFSDVQFTFGDKELHSHKNILSKRSPVFAAMFRNEMRERHENKVEITDIRYDVFLEMLRHIYTEKVNGLAKIAGELLVAADKYSLGGLTLTCEKSLIDNVNADNVLDNLHLADQHSVQGLKTKCIEFIVTNAAVVVKKPEFRKLRSDIVFDVCNAMADKIK